MLSRSFFGIRPWYTVPPFEFTSVTQLPWFVCLGALAGVMGAVFLKSLGLAEGAFSRLRVPIYVRLALGGLLVGLIALGYPEVWGNGYFATNRILSQEFLELAHPMIFLIGLYAAKLLATMATVGSGAVGGVFTPTLFLGAGLGATFGLGLREFHIAEHLPMAVFALVGMGGMLSATVRSPLLAMIMIFEISHDYSLMPALMLASVVAILVSRRLHPESIYTEPLRRKGLIVPADPVTSEAATERTVADLMRAPVPPLRETTTFREIADRFLSSSHNFLPVVDAEGRLVGMVALQDLKEYLAGDQEVLGVIAYDVMRPPPPSVTPNQRLLEALPLALVSEQRNIPVVSSLQENRLVGALVRAEVLGIFSELIAAHKKEA
jgi:CIC family chloride channel protein